MSTPLNFSPVVETDEQIIHALDKQKSPMVLVAIMHHVAQDVRDTLGGPMGGVTANDDLYATYADLDQKAA